MKSADHRNRTQLLSALFSILFRIDKYQYIRVEPRFMIKTMIILILDAIHQGVMTLINKDLFF